MDFAGRLFAFSTAACSDQPVSSCQRIAPARSLKPGKALKFEFTRGGIRREGFVVRFKGKLAAYENVCRHIPVALDSGDGDFFTRDGKHLICAAHGALYEPLSGLCLRGPCEGASLKPLPVAVCDGFIEVTIPADDDGDDWRHKDWR